MIPPLMILIGCSNTKMIDGDCLWLQPYPKLTAEQHISIHQIAPLMTTWQRDYKTEYKENCSE